MATRIIAALDDLLHYPLVHIRPLLMSRAPAAKPSALSTSCRNYRSATRLRHGVRVADVGQAELAKSKDTGAELHLLSSSMGEIQDTLSGGIVSSPTVTQVPLIVSPLHRTVPPQTSSHPNTDPPRQKHRLR